MCNYNVQHIEFNKVFCCPPISLFKLLITVPQKYLHCICSVPECSFDIFTCVYGHPDYKGISTYEYILSQRKKNPKPSLCRRVLTRLRKTRKKKNRVTPSNLPDGTDQARAMEEGHLSSLPSDIMSQRSLSNESVGLNNFGRTPTTVST